MANQNRSVDLFERMGAEMYREALGRQQMSLSAYLETQDPTPAEDKSGLDAFARVVRAAGIRVKAVRGIPADRFEKFLATPQTRALVTEWAWRVVRNAQRAVFISGDGTPGTALYPYSDSASPRTDKQIAPAIPLSALVARTETAAGDAFRAVYMLNDTNNQRRRRVAEGAEIPAAKTLTAENATKLYKYGRRLDMTYESMRRLRIDRVAFLLARMAVQIEMDKVSEAIDALVNGDGNTVVATSPTVYNLTALDPAATANTLTLKGWIAFKMLFAQPYMLTTAIGQSDAITQLMLLSTGNANIPLVTIQNASNLGSITPINTGTSDNVQVGWTSDAPAAKIIGLDNRFALEEVIEADSQVEETSKWVERQTQTIVLSENSGVNRIDPTAVKILNLAA